MKAKENLTRRTFIGRCAGTGAALLGTVLLLNSCGGGSEESRDSAVDQGTGAKPADPCTDFTGVSAQELEKRKKLGYVDRSEVPGSNCANCGLYVPPADGAACGSCLLFKGPVYGEGHCIQWVAKGS